MTTNKSKKSIENPVTNKLKKFIVNLVKLTQKEENEKAKQGIELRNILVEYMNNDKTGLQKNGWKMSVLRNIIYDLAQYDSSQKDIYGVSMANKTFENRVTRAVIDAVLLFNRANPTDKTQDCDNGYQLNDKGQLCLPYNTLQPTVLKKIKGVNQELPNENSQLIPINVELRKTHFSELYPEGTRKNKSGTGAKDWENKMTELTQYLLKLSNEDLIEKMSLGNSSKDTKTPFEIRLEELENTIGKIFTRKSGLVQTYEGKVIDTSVKKAVNN